MDCFIADIGAAAAARLLALNRKTINTWYAELRARLLRTPRSPVLNARVLHGFHERRIAKFNGLDKRLLGVYRRESEVRFAQKKRFGALVRGLSADLLG